MTSSAIETAIKPAVRRALRLAAVRAFDVRRASPGARGDGMRGTVTDVSWSCKKAPVARPCSSASRGEGAVSSQTSGAWSARAPTVNAVCPRSGRVEGVWGNREVPPATAAASSSRTNPTPEAEASVPGRYDDPHAGRGADDPDPPLDSAGRGADHGADRAPDRREGLSRGLPLPRRRADRAPARSACARAGEALDSARVVYRNRLPQLCRRAGRRRVRRGLDRRRPDGIGCQSSRRLPYDRERTAPADRIRAGRRPPTALARHASPGANRHRRAGPGLRRQHPGPGRREVHVGGDRLRPRRGDLDLPAPLQHRADRRRVDLHAPRHEPAQAGGRPSPSAEAGQARARRADGEGGCRLRPGPGAPVADHRHERRNRALGAGEGRARRGRATPTPFCSAPGSRWPS